MARWLLTTGDTRSHRHQQVSLGTAEWVTSYCLGEEHSVAPLAAGDVVALMRAGRGGGIVAHGHVEDIISEHGESENHWPRCREHKVTVLFDELFLGWPIEREWLRPMTPWASRAFANARRGPRRPIEIPDDAWHAVVRLAKEEREIWWPARWDIAPGTVVARADLHRIFGGWKNTRITASDDTPNVLLFKGDGPGANDSDEWSDDGALLVPGMEGDGKTLTFHNESVVKHVRRGRPLRVFQSSPRGRCTYLGEFAIDQSNSIERWIGTGRERVIKNIYTPSMPDTRYERMMPVFRLFPLDAVSSLPLTAPSRKRLPPQRLRISMSLAPDSAAGHFVPSTRPGSASSSREGESTDVAASIANLLALLRDHQNARDTVAQLDAAAVLSDFLERRLRWAGLTELRGIIDDPTSRECAIQRVLQRHTWMFGGQYVGRAARRALALRDQIDIPLIRSDGTLHGVELKTANVDDLVKEHRSHLIVGPAVNEAVGQAMNYLRGLDEQRATILTELGIDCRRATMTVVIGHPRYVKCDVTAADVAEPSGPTTATWPASR